MITLEKAIDAATTARTIQGSLPCPRTADERRAAVAMLEANTEYKSALEICAEYVEVNATNEDDVKQLRRGIITADDLVFRLWTDSLELA